MIKCCRILNKGRCNGEMKAVEVIDGGKVYKCQECGAIITTNIVLEELKND